MEISKKGILLVLSGPSGSGKGTVVNEILARSDNYSLSVSNTTREPRPGEIDGVHYNFVSVEEFERLIADNEMLEYTYYCDNYYGTPLKNVVSQLEEGINVILEIEVEGGTNIKKIFPEAVLVMILPPDYKTLENRLRTRGTNSEESIKTRMERAKVELEYLSDYDYIVINDNGLVDETALSVISITDSERHKVSRNKHVPTDFYLD